MGGIECHLQCMLFIYRCTIISNKTFVPNLFRVGVVVNRSTVRDAGCECAPWVRSANPSDSWALVMRALRQRCNF